MLGKKLLDAIYEQEFLDCSFGFRPRRSPQQALEAVREAVMAMDGGWVLDVDVRKFFDTIPHRKLREVLSRRIGDGVITKLIHKWLKAGVWEAGEVTYPEAGTPQGGIIPPALSNVFLHEVLDGWFEFEIKPTLRGKAVLIRYADDFVVVCEHRDDAEALLEQVKVRFESYGLAIHPEKTRIVDFRHPWKNGHQSQTFDFLGFTHYWGKTRRGGYAVARKTRAGKFGAALQRIERWCKKHRHKRLQEQHEELSAQVSGHYTYYGIRGNCRELVNFRDAVKRKWHYWLTRRSRKRSDAERLWELLRTHLVLPAPRIVHVAPVAQLKWSFPS